MVYVMVSWITGLWAEWEKKILPSFSDSEIGIAGINLEVDFVALAVEYGQHQIVKLRIESSRVANMEDEGRFAHC